MRKTPHVGSEACCRAYELAGASSHKHKCRREERPNKPASAAYGHAWAAWFLSLTLFEFVERSRKIVQKALGNWLLESCHSRQRDTRTGTVSSSAVAVCSPQEASSSHKAFFWTSSSSMPGTLDLGGVASEGPTGATATLVLNASTTRKNLVSRANGPGGLGSGC